MRSDGLAEITIRRERVHYRFGVTSLQRGLVAADDITRVGVPGPEYRRSEVATTIDRPLAAVGAEHHRPVVVRFGDDRHRPHQLLPVVVQARQQFHHGPPAGTRGGHGLDPGVEPGQPGQVVAQILSRLHLTSKLGGSVAQHVRGSLGTSGVPRLAERADKRAGELDVGGPRVGNQ
jgi:hypothetical protein